MSPTATPTSPQRAHGASRERVLQVLRDSTQPQGVGALTEATGLSANAVRFHLQHLIDAGAVRAGGDPAHAGPGRPAILYAATPRAASDPSTSYRLLASLLAGALRRSASPDAATQAGRDWATAIAPRDFDGPPIALVQSLFADSGFAPRAAGDGHTLELHQCPFLDLAIEAPEIVCTVHLGLVTGLLEQNGTPRQAHLTPVLDGSGPCLLRLDDPAQPTEPTEPTDPTDPTDGAAAPSGRPSPTEEPSP